MKTFFKKFRASVALDQADKLRQRCGTGESRRFEESLRAMDGNLRKPRVGDDVPPGLHASIMRAVSTSGVESEPFFLWRRFAVAALVLGVGVGVFWSVRRVPVKVADVVPSSKSPPSFAAAVEQGHELTQAAPKVVLEPLSSEWDLLNGDFQHAVKFVTASVP